MGASLTNLATPFPAAPILTWADTVICEVDMFAKLNPIIVVSVLSAGQV
jgi:hypothetical protein